MKTYYIPCENILDYRLIFSMLDFHQFVFISPTNFDQHGENIFIVNKDTKEVNFVHSLEKDESISFTTANEFEDILLSSRQANL